MAVSGDVPYIQLWDCATESRVTRLPTGVNSCLTSICADKMDSNMFLAGYGNGTVRLYDARAGDDAATVHYAHHKSWVLNVHIQPAGLRHLMSGSKEGDVLWWDTRFPGEPFRRLAVRPLCP